MKSKYETLLSVVKYVQNESENPIDELLLMGFTPCQLVREFGFDEKKVKTSPIFGDIEDSLNEKLDEKEYPFLLDGYNDFDASLISRFEMTDEMLKTLKCSDCYQKMLTGFKEEKESDVTEVLDAVFDRFENEILCECQKGKTSLEKQLLVAKDTVSKQNRQHQIQRETVQNETERE